MKNILTISVFIILVSFGSTRAQFGGKLNRLTDRITDKVLNRAADKVGDEAANSTDKAIDKAINGGANKEDKGSKSNIFDRFSSAPAADDTYDFIASMTNRITTKDKKGKVIVNEMIYRLNNTSAGNYMGMEMKNISGMQDQKGNMNTIMVMDFNKNAIYTLISSDGKKSQIGMTIPQETPSTTTEHGELEMSIKKLGGTKTILGYTCENYQMDVKNGSMILWVSKIPVKELKDFNQKIAKSNLYSPKTKEASYYNNSEIQKIMADGRTVLGTESLMGDTEMHSEIVKISNSDKYSINTLEYPSIMAAKK